MIGENVSEARCDWNLSAPPGTVHRDWPSPKRSFVGRYLTTLIRSKTAKRKMECSVGSRQDDVMGERKFASAFWRIFSISSFSYQTCAEMAIR